jgi:hypothetical protein
LTKGNPVVLSLVYKYLLFIPSAVIFYPNSCVLVQALDYFN